MSRESVLIVLALLVIIAPFSGVPYAWLEILLPLIGVIVLGIGISLRRRTVPSSSPETPA